MKIIIDMFRYFVNKYDMKHNKSMTKNLYICTNIETRNRNKLDKWKIPHDKPQCPIYHDNRCCGACNLASTCDHCVNCNCYGYQYAQRGGNDKSVMMRKCSDTSIGRIGKDGNFNWDYFNKERNKINKKRKKKKRTVR